MSIFFHRQILRLRNNSLRREPFVSVNQGLSEAEKVEIYRGIDVVRQFQLLRAPKFTEITSIAEHAKAPYLSRMIALDELREIDQQLEFVNFDLARNPGETTYSYLSRIKRIALPSLSESLIERLGMLAEHCRYGTDSFGVSELSEVRVLIKEVVKTLNDEQKRLSALKFRLNDEGTELEPILPSLSRNTIRKTTIDSKVSYKLSVLGKSKVFRVLDIGNEKSASKV